MKNIYPLFIALLLISNFYAGATDYYFSANGDDNNTGTSEISPWKTIDKANTLRFTLTPGDRMLFRRGDTFRGELLIGSSGSSSNPITITSYGTGDNAVLSGSEYINNWESVGNGIYRAACSVKPNLVFQNGKPQMSSRYPNEGFLFIDGANGNIGFSDDGLVDGGSLYEGAIAHIRTARWMYEERTVGVQSGKYLGLTTPTNLPLSNGAGYYLTNKLEFIDAITEYYYDEQNQQLYLKTENGAIPNFNSVEASQYIHGVKLDNDSYVTISGLTIKHQQSYGLYMIGAPSTNIIVDNCVFEHIFKRGIIANQRNALQISNCKFNDIWSNAILVSSSANLSIENNVFKRIAIAAPGQAIDFGAIYYTIDLGGSSAIVRNNLIDSVGFNAIQFYQNDLIEKNRIKNYCMSIDDGAAINCFGNTNGIRNGTGSIIRNNIISDPVGNNGSFPISTQILVNGIGMDNYSGNALIENNTVYNSKGRGISIYNSAFNQVRNNTVFNCNNGALVFEHGDGDFPQGNVAANNILYNFHEEEYSLRLHNWTQGNTSIDFASFSNNYYVNPYFSANVYTANFYITNGNFDLDQQYRSATDWISAKDVSGKRSPVSLNDYQVTSSTNVNLLYNGNFNSNLDGWECEAYNNSCGLTWQNSNILDGGAVRISSPIDNYGGFHNRPERDFLLQQGKKYLLNYSQVGDLNKIHAVELIDRNTWQSLTPKKIKEITILRRDQQILLSPSATTNLGRIQFTAGPAYSTGYSLDNLFLQEVTATPIDPATRNLLFTNETNNVKTIQLSGTYIDIDGNFVSGSITLQPFTSKILIVTDQGPLPLNILSINAKELNANSSVVDWTLASSDVGCKVDVQKSIDGVNFVTIGSVPTNPNSANHYNFTDNQFNITCYYRLSSYCPGEAAVYSKIVELKKAGNVAAMAVYPNPIVGNKLYLDNTETYTQATIVGMEGRQIKQYNLTNGINTIQLPNDLPRGTYLLKVSGNDLPNKIFKVVK